MAYYLASRDDITVVEAAPRFQALRWTVNGNRESSFDIVSTDPDTATKATIVFRTQGDFVAMEWFSKDFYDHGLLHCGVGTVGTDGKYDWDDEAARDYSNIVLAAHLKFTNCTAPNAGTIHDPQLVFERWTDHDTPNSAAAVSVSAYVNLATYKTGGAYADGNYTIPLSAALAAATGIGADGTLYPAGSFNATNWDRVYISVTPTAYTGIADLNIPILPAVTATVEISNISVTGSGTTQLQAGARGVRAHRLKQTCGYDDIYNLDPKRMIRNWEYLGYRGRVNIYTGATHGYDIVWDAAQVNSIDGTVGGFVVTNPGRLNPCSTAWFTDFYTACKAASRDVVISIAYEIIMQFTPLGHDSVWTTDWGGKNKDGEYGMTGYQPPTTINDVCNAEASQWTIDVALAHCAIQQALGANIIVQIGEPWHWVQLQVDAGTGAKGSGETITTGNYFNHILNGPCFYGDAISAAFVADTSINPLGSPLPAVASLSLTTYNPTALIDNVLYPGKTYADLFTWLRNKLGDSTNAIRDGVKAGYPDAKVAVLWFPPQVIGNANFDAGLMAHINFAKDHWTPANYDFQQMEAYGWSCPGPTTGNNQADAAANNVPDYGRFFGDGGVTITLYDGTVVSGLLGVFAAAGWTSAYYNVLEFFGGFADARISDPTSAWFETPEQYVTRYTLEWQYISETIRRMAGFGLAYVYPWSDSQVRKNSWVWTGDDPLANLLVTGGPTPPSGSTLTGLSSLDVILLGAYNDANGNQFPRRHFALWDVANARWRPKKGNIGDLFRIPGANIGDREPPPTQFRERLVFDDSSIEKQSFTHRVVATSPNEWIYGSEEPEGLIYFEGTLIEISNSLRVPEAFSAGNGGGWDCLDTDARTGSISGVLACFQITLAHTPLQIVYVARVQGGVMIPLVAGVGYSISGTTITFLDGYKPVTGESISVLYA